MVNPDEDPSATSETFVGDTWPLWFRVLYWMLPQKRHPWSWVRYTLACSVVSFILALLWLMGNPPSPVVGLVGAGFTVVLCLSYGLYMTRRDQYVSYPCGWSPFTNSRALSQESPTTSTRTAVRVLVAVVAVLLVGAIVLSLVHANVWLVVACLTGALFCSLPGSKQLREQDGSR